MSANGDLRMSRRSEVVLRALFYSRIQTRPPDRGTSHGNVKHDYSRRDNMCNNNRISQPRTSYRAAGDLVLVMEFMSMFLSGSTTHRSVSP